MKVVKKNESKNLNQKNYTLSVLNEGLRNASISNVEKESFLLQVMNILKDLIMRYTKGESTSVTVETAENIMNSIFYCIDVGLKNLNETEAVIKALKSDHINQIYDKGLELVTACFNESMLIYDNIKKTRLKVGLEIYDSIIDEAFPNFFEKYGAVFDAHNTMASIDYPLIFDDISKSGIFYVRSYLRTLEIENEFCNLFPEKEIIKILTIYGKIYKIDYTKTATNIFELVMNACFFSVISNGGTHELIISSTQCDILVKKLSEINSLKLNLVINEAINKIISDMNIKGTILSEYIERYKTVLVTRLKFALETKSIKKLILIEEDIIPITTEQTIFIDRDKMMNDDFIELVDRLTSGLDSTTKIKIIRSEIYSMEDFKDILEADCLFGDEYFLLFSELSNQELGLLAKIIFSDEMRDDNMNLSKTISMEIYTGILWHEFMVEFLKALNDERLKLIEDQMNTIISME